jgi:hypothetical protein
MSAAMTPEHLK